MISVGSVVQIYSGPPAFARRGCRVSGLRLGRPARPGGWNVTAKAVAPKLPRAAKADRMASVVAQGVPIA